MKLFAATETISPTDPQLLEKIKTLPVEEVNHFISKYVQKLSGDKCIYGCSVCGTWVRDEENPLEMFIHQLSILILN